MAKNDETALTETHEQFARQYAALPFRKTSGLQILLITSRETKRWVIPKGWPIKGKKPHQAAAQEALEEAGVTGKAIRFSLGTYIYWKTMPDQPDIAAQVEVFPFKVKSELSTWQEAHERQRQWVDPEQAAQMVIEPGLQLIIRAFALMEG